MLRAADCGDPIASATSLIGPHGTPAPASTSSQAAAGWVRSAPSRAAFSASLPSCRAALLAKRGSVSSAGSPSAVTRAPNSTSLAAQMVMSRSAQANVSNGAIEKCALPIRPGSTPVAR